MTDPAPPPAPPPLPTEPLSPPPAKIAPDDPRLRVGRARGRTLKKGPAIVALGAGLGVVVLALALALQPATPPPGPPKAESEPTTAPQPPTVPQVIQEATPAGSPPPAGDRLLVMPLPDGGPLARPVDLSGGERGGPDPRSAEREQRLEQDRKAAAASVLFEGRTEPTPAPEPPPPGSPLGASTSRAATSAGEADPNHQERKNAFLDPTTTGAAPDTLVARLRHPQSPYEIQAGTIVPATLVTGINSDLPGPVVGQVRENVYDTVTGNTLLIPQGARLLAAYDSMVVWGQERVLVCWNRLVFPNGDSIDLQCMPAADLQGAAGLSDSVDEHWWRIVKGASVATLLAATTTVGAGSTEGYSPSVGQTMARNAAGEVNRVGQQVTGRNLDIQPTLTVRPGYSVNVILTKDVILAPYGAPGAAPGPSPLFWR